MHLPFNFSSRNSHLNFEAITTQNTNDRFEFETQTKVLTNKSQICLNSGRCQRKDGRELKLEAEKLWTTFTLRYESSSLKLYKELSSSIFQSCQSVSLSGMRDTLPDLHFVQYIKA